MNVKSHRRSQARNSNDGRLTSINIGMHVGTSVGVGVGVGVRARGQVYPSGHRHRSRHTWALLLKGQKGGGQSGQSRVGSFSPVL